MKKEYKKPGVKLDVIKYTTLLGGSNQKIGDGGSNSQEGAPGTAQSKENFSDFDEDIDW